jgi:hypothetical protein
VTRSFATAMIDRLCRGGVRLTVRATALCLAVLTASGSLAAQPSLRLGRPDASSGPDFERIVAVRELRDGSVLLVDRGGNALLHLQTLESAPRRLGRVGSGPLEYRTAGHLWALGGDSSLFIDEYTGRWLVLRASTLVGQFSESRAANLLVRSRSDGASAFGDVVTVRPTKFRHGVPRTENTADSLAVIRVGIANGRVDTLAVIAGFGGSGVTRIPARGKRPEFLLDFNPLAASEQVLLH